MPVTGTQLSSMERGQTQEIHEAIQTRMFNLPMACLYTKNIISTGIRKMKSCHCSGRVYH